jgi:hypothetical protein
MKAYSLFLLVFLWTASSAGKCEEPLVPKARLVECAASAVEFAKRTHQVALDFSPPSLAYVDGMMDDFHAKKLPFAKVENHVRVMGCYTAEVFIRNLGGKWIYPEPDAVQQLGPGPFVELRNGTLINPLVKVQSIYEDGLEHSVRKFYGVVEAAIK